MWRDDDDDDEPGRVRRFVCVVCKRIILRRDMLVEHGGKVYCVKCARERGLTDAR